MKRTDSPGTCSPGSPVCCKPTTPCLLSPTRIRRILVRPAERSVPRLVAWGTRETLWLTGSLSDEISGTPRHEMKGEPKILTLGGGTPRRVHSRPKAAIALG